MILFTPSPSLDDYSKHCSFQSTHVSSALEAFLGLIRYINSRFTYLLTCTGYIHVTEDNKIEMKKYDPQVIYSEMTTENVMTTEPDLNTFSSSCVVACSSCSPLRPQRLQLPT